MAHRKSTLQRPDGQFIAIAKNITEQSVMHASDWNLEPEQLAMLQTLTENANVAYVANTNPASKNHITSVDKRYAFDELKRFLGTYINFLEGNMHVSDEALAVMQLRPRSHPARLPASPPTIPPVVSVVRKHDELIVHVAKLQMHPTSSIAPGNYYAFALRWKFEDETEYRTVISTRLHHTLIFDRKDEARRVIISAAFVNPRLQPGPWSDEITEVIG